MRKILVLSAVATVLFVGALSVGAAAALTAAPVFYDARSPHPAPSVGDDLDLEAGAAPPGPDGSAGGAGDEGDGVAPSPDATQRPSPGAPRPAPGAPPAAPAPTPPAASTPPPSGPIPTEEEQAAWLAFQQLVRECMTESGQEYRSWEWWTIERGDPNSTAPAMPDDLTGVEQLAWLDALEGPNGDGTGCIGEATERDREEAVAPPPAAPEPSPDPERPAPAVPEPSAPDAVGSMPTAATV
ncbi:hypothetical protein [Agromyces italicus]|uniref:hypothetical protein n=1 Tax=Agromyces italicus TaxID=279572 RepID=UPI0003B49C3B|nr:hypothetical protein [Agromyces italicus]